MEGFKPLTIDEAKQLAEKWMQKLKEYCSRVDVVAGVYRGKPVTSDVDLLCEVKEGKSLEELKPVKKDSLRFVFSDPDQDKRPRKVEVWYTTEERYPLYLWYRRTPKEEFIKLASKAREKGYRLSWKRGLLKDGKVVTSDPKEIEKALR